MIRNSNRPKVQSAYTGNQAKWGEYQNFRLQNIPRPVKAKWVGETDG